MAAQVLETAAYHNSNIGITVGLYIHVHHIIETSSSSTCILNQNSRGMAAYIYQHHQK